MNLIGSQKAKLPSWRKMCRMFSIAGFAVAASFVFEGCENTGSYGYGGGGYYGDDLYGYGGALFVGGRRHGEHFGGHHMIGRGGGFGRAGGGFGGGHGGGGHGGGGRGR